MKAKVIWFDQKKGFGFLAVEGRKDLFVHYSNIVAEGFKSLDAEQEVDCELGANHKGEQAINVKVSANKG